MQKRISLTPDSTRCSTCMLNSFCLPIGMPPTQVQKLDEVVQERIRLRKGDALFRQGEEARAIYGIRSGSVKTQVEDARGQVQVTGFLLPGEIVGMDGYLNNTQVTHALALEDSEVCVARIEDMERITRLVPELRQQLRRLTNEEFKRTHQLVRSLGLLTAEQRVAAFLLNMSQRLAALGYSSTEFVLRMSREEIGNYLGLTLETVSRLFSRFARENLIRVQQRRVQLLDLPALRELSGTDCG